MLRKKIASNWGLVLPFAIIFFALLIGFLIVTDYGLSWDEHGDMSYGEIALRAYKGSEDFLWMGGDRKYYGPFYWMFARIVSKSLDLLGIKAFYVDVWKYCHFLMFQIALVSFYFLCSRFMSRTLSFWAVLLFATQPLLFGHAFINAKDIPFMSFFMTSIVVGLTGADIFQKQMRDSRTSSFAGKSLRVAWNSHLDQWHESSIIRRAILTALAILFVLLLVELFWLNSLFLPWMQRIVLHAYEGTAVKPIIWLFKHIAEDAYKTPVELYIDKIDRMYGFVRFLPFVVLAFAGSALWRGIFREGRQKKSIKGWLKAHYALLLAGVLLGLTNSIRIAAPFAGVLVSVYFLAKSRHRALIPLLLYWSMAFMATYATWPYLWKSPIDNFIESANVASGFASHKTLFQGIYVLSEELPWYYVPYLMGIQFTEPLILLGIVGLSVSIVRLQKRAISWLDLAILMLWAGLPLTLSVIMGIPIYDNFRQLLFVVPPMAAFSGIGLAAIIELVRSRAVKLMIIIMVLIPGLINIVKLHPYEYIYYNSIVGGVNGASGNYELDYWCTSTKEAINYLNNVAPADSALYIEDPSAAAIHYAREDIRINDADVLREDLDFAIACRYSILQADYYPDFETMYEVRRGTSALSVIKAQR